MKSQNGNHEDGCLNKISSGAIVRNANQLESENQPDSVKVSDEEINSIECFSKLSASQKDELKDFIFSLSSVLYKSFNNESA